MRLRFGSIVCLAMALASATGVAATDAATGQIAAQAKYWEQKGRFDLAREAWLKLLRIDPDSADALAGLAAAEIRSGRPEMAKQYLHALRQMRPDHPDLDRLETALARGMATSAASDNLALARELARTQRYDEAITEYQRVFGGKPPEGAVALEYWQTMAGAEGGWVEARRGLERLVERRPDNPDYRLALAQVLTYREETRRQGLDQLMELAKTDAARQPVQPVWRQALLWMGGRPQDQRYFQAYLQRYGDDTQVANKLAAARTGGGGEGVAGGAAPRVDPRGRALKQAWAHFNAGRIDEAEKDFAEMRRRNPRDAEALAGLGVIRLQQDRFGEARELLQEASRRSPGRAAQWRSALASARFWEQVRLAELERDKGRLSQAEERLRSALAAAPSISAREPSVRVTLADIVLAQNRPTQAETMYREILSSDPGNPDAARGLIAALSQSGRVTEALVVYRGLTPQQQDKIGSVASLQALAYRQQAAEAMAKNDASGAERLLREALVADPQATWPRLDLARLYIAQDRRDEARSLIEGLPTGGPQRGEAAYIRALIASEEQNWYDGLMWLEQVPQNERSREMADVQQRLWVRYQTERAAVLARQGRRDEAIALLAGIEPYARSPERVGAMAFAYSEAGEAGRGLYLLRQAIARNPKADVDLRLAYAGLLLKLQQHAEFDSVVDHLARGPQLTPPQEATLTELRVAQRLRLADEVRQRGNVARAYDLLEPALRANPEDPRLVMALASLYDEAGEHDRAASLYRYALKLDSDNLDAYQGMVRASLANGREDEADLWLDEAMRIAPDSRKLHVLAGRVAKARGDDGTALKYFRRALELDPDGGGGRGKLRLQMLDTHLRPVSQRRGDVALPRSRAARGSLRKVSTRARPVADPWNANLSGQPYVQLAQAGTTASDLPPIPPPGYKLPRFEPQPQRDGLRLDVPRTFDPPPLGPEALKLRMDPMLRTRDYAHEQPKVTSTETDEILREIAELDDRRSMWVGVGVGLRNRDGLSGLDQLDDIELPMEVSFGAFAAGRLNLRVVPVFLDAGTVSGGELPLFGTLAFADTTGLSFEQNDGGLAAGVAYQLGTFIVDVGTTPIGFEVGTVVGGIGWTPRFGNWIVDFDISRRPVTDSLLSYAGTRDPVSGREWGGVTANGGRVEVTYDLGKGGLYGSGGFHFYEGKNVEDNTETSLGGGAYLHVYRDAIQRVTVGFNITSFFFDENLRRFTFGHGGYFSPERYLSLALPVEWVGGHHRYSWKLHGAIGLQNFREEGAALYPEDSALQAAIEEFSAANPDLFIATGYGSNSHTGTGLSFGGQVEYLIAPQLVIGARAGFDNAQDYDETRVLAYLRWSPGRAHAVQVPPRPVVPFADYRKKLP